MESKREKDQREWRERCEKKRAEWLAAAESAYLADPTNPDLLLEYIEEKDTGYDSFEEVLRMLR
jgi:hypothetical protein